jgi:transketolase
MDDKNFTNGQGVPMGLGMALAQNIDAMTYFSSLGDREKEQVINQTHTIQSKDEMRQFVSSMVSKDSFR